MTYQLLASSRVTHGDSPILQRLNVAEITKSVLNRRLRAHGVRLMRELDEFGSFSYRFNLVHAIRQNDDNWARLRGYEAGDDGFEVYCDGPRARDAIERVNDALSPKNLAQRERRKKLRRIGAKRRLREEKQKRLDKERSKRRELHKKSAPRKKKRDRFLELFAKNNVKPQFKNSPLITLHDAKYAVAWIFKDRTSAYRTASQRAEYRLLCTLDHSEGRFATRTKECFTLCFEVVGSWRGEETQLRIAFTDDNKHPLYSRARKYFKGLLMGQPQHRVLARRRLRAALEQDVIRLAA